MLSDNRTLTVFTKEWENYDVVAKSEGFKSRAHALVFYMREINKRYEKEIKKIKQESGHIRENKKNTWIDKENEYKNVVIRVPKVVWEDFKFGAKLAGFRSRSDALNKYISDSIYKTI